MRYYIIAGEASGDMHGANLIREIRSADTSSEIRACGGDRMKNAGASLLLHYRDLAFMGFWEVIVNLRKILRYFRLCKKDILKFKPDVVVLIDYPGFNLRMAKFLKKQGIRVIYYISPQVWAWKASRVNTIRKYTDEMIVILPFEKDFYKNYNVDVHYAGHPLLDVIDNLEPDKDFHKRHSMPDKAPVALLPGSRKQEISRMLPVMLQAAERFRDHTFAIATAPGIDTEFYKQFVANYPHIHLVQNDTYQLLLHAKAALVTSGTATLETALFNVPQAACYKGSAFSFFIGRMLVNISYISLVNLILDKPCIKELIQNDFNAGQVYSELDLLLNDESTRIRILTDYKALRTKLGGPGASKAAAKIITGNYS